MMYAQDSPENVIARYSYRAQTFLGESIGVENNNPGNIRDSTNVHFKGEMSPRQGFKRFTDRAHGYRALIKNLQAYINQSGADTIWKMIHRWAPFGDGNNNPDNYARKVSKRSGIGLNKKIASDDLESLQKIASAISIQEIGKVYTGDLDDAVNMLLYEQQSGMSAVITVSGRKPRPWVLAGFAILAVIGNEVNKKYPPTYRGTRIYK